MFDEMMTQQRRVNFEGEEGEEFLLPPKSDKSLWMLFLDAIQRYPRLTRLKDVIDRAGIEKNSYEQE
jgi:hypothetical protein